MKKKVIKYLLFAVLLSIPNIVFAAPKVNCGNVVNIPRKIPELTSFFITAAQVATTVILVILGSIDLFKGLISSKEDEIKKGQQIFIKRIIVAALIFFIVVIVKFLIGIIADSSTSNVIDCIDCFISNDCIKSSGVDTSAGGNGSTAEKKYCRPRCSSFTEENFCNKRGQNGKVCTWSNGKCVNVENSQNYCNKVDEAICASKRDNTPYGCEWVSK